MKSIKPLIVDYNPKFIYTMQEYLSSQSLIEIVDFAMSGFDASEMITETKPDLLLLDYMLLEKIGFDLLNHIHTLPEPPRVIILSNQAYAAYPEAAVAVSADGFVDKAEFAKVLMPLVISLFKSIE